MKRSSWSARNVPWQLLSHAYGSAIDVPQILIDLESDDEDIRDDAIYGGLWSAVFHQYTLYSATPYTIPFVIKILRKPNVLAVDQLLHFIRCCAECGDKAISTFPTPRNLRRKLKCISLPKIRDVVVEGQDIYEFFADAAESSIVEDAKWLAAYCRDGVV